MSSTDGQEAHDLRKAPIIRIGKELTVCSYRLKKDIILITPQLVSI